MSVIVTGSTTVIRRIRVVIVQQDVVSGIILHRVGTGNRNRCEVIVQKIRENQYRQQFFLCLPWKVLRQESAADGLGGRIVLKNWTSKATRSAISKCCAMVFKCLTRWSLSSDPIQCTTLAVGSPWWRFEFDPHDASFRGHT